MRVESLHVAPARGAPMVERSRIVVEAGAGIIGDRYRGTRHRHVTVQAASDLDAAAAELARPVTAAQTRRNIVVDDGPIPTAPGSRLQIGEVTLEVVRVAAPCRIMDDTLGPGGRAALHARGGSVCRALTSGEIALLDEVIVG